MKNLLSLLMLLAIGSELVAITPDWTRQFGTTAADSAQSIDIDAQGNIYITGSTQGALGQNNFGDWDVFLSKYDTHGNHIWTEQLGSPDADFSNGLSVDDLGNIYITGTTSGTLGKANLGDQDAFVSKLDSQGKLLWTQQFGSNLEDRSSDLSVDNLGNIYVAGWIDGERIQQITSNGDAFLSKFDTSGNLIWTERVGTPSLEYGTDVAVDNLGNLYISGWLEGSLRGDWSAFISKYDTSGSFAWTQRPPVGGASISTAISADMHGNVYVTGWTHGNVLRNNDSSIDAFISKYDHSGNLIWATQIGAVKGYTIQDISNDIYFDSQGNVYITGQTEGNLEGVNAGPDDAFIGKFDALGNLVWIQQFGTPANDRAAGIVLDDFDNLYVVGSSSGDLAAINFGSSDIFITKLSTGVPEPSASLLLLLACSLAGSKQRY